MKQRTGFQLYIILSRPSAPFAVVRFVCPIYVLLCPCVCLGVCLDAISPSRSSVYLPDDDDDDDADDDDDSIRIYLRALVWQNHMQNQPHDGFSRCSVHGEFDTQ